MSDAWLGVDLITGTKFKSHMCLKEIGLCVEILISILGPIINVIRGGHI